MELRAAFPDLLLKNTGPGSTGSEIGSESDGIRVGLGWILAASVSFFGPFFLLEFFSLLVFFPLPHFSPSSPLSPFG